MGKHSVLNWRALFEWAGGQLAQACQYQDLESAQYAVVLSALCVRRNRAWRAGLTDRLDLLEAAWQTAVDKTGPVELLLQYGLVYRATRRQPSPGFSGRISQYTSVLASLRAGEIDRQVLPSYLLALRLLGDRSTPAGLSPDKGGCNLDVDLLLADTYRLRSVVDLINSHTRFGLVPTDCTAYPVLLASLQIRLLTATKDYDILLVCQLLRSLAYLGCQAGLAIDTARLFLLSNQDHQGFFGYYDEEFQELQREKPVHWRASMLRIALEVARATLESGSVYRFYRDLG